MKELVGSFCSGDFRRTLMIDATGMNAANFTTFSTGIGTTDFVITNKYLHDFPREWYRCLQMGIMAQLPRHQSEEKYDKPAYLTDVKFGMMSAIMIEGMVPNISMLKAQFGEYKYTMYHNAHNVDRILEVCTDEWDKYQATWRAEGHDHAYVPYPYTRDVIDKFFRDYSEVTKAPISVQT